LGKHTSFVLATLSIVWIILSEDISWRGLAIGLLVAMICMHFSAKFLPFEEVYDINFYKLATYPFYLLWQILLAGLLVAKLVLTNSLRTGIVYMPTNLKSETLRVMLMYSMTLTPGSIPYDIEGDRLKVLWVHHANVPNDGELAEKMIKVALENRLKVAHREHVITDRI